MPFNLFPILWRLLLLKFNKLLNFCYFFRNFTCNSSIGRLSALEKTPCCVFYQTTPTVRMMQAYVRFSPVEIARRTFGSLALL